MSNILGTLTAKVKVL